MYNQSKLDLFPNFFVVGLSKSATTYLATLLFHHPQICFTSKKEPNFFCQFDRNIGEIPNNEIYNYQSYFSHYKNEKLIGEGSVSYLSNKNAIHWIRKYSPKAKIIIMLRNPIDRIVSLYEMYLRLGKKNISRKEAFKRHSYLIGQCLIFNHIKKYIEDFSIDSIYFIIFDDFIKNTDVEFEKLCQFLGVSEIYQPVVKSKNLGGVPKSKLFNLFTNRTIIKYTKKIVPSIKIQTIIDNFIKATFFQKITLSVQEKRGFKNIFL